MLVSWELGSTDLVTHSIDTGDSLPVKQPARHTPLYYARSWMG